MLSAARPGRPSPTSPSRRRTATPAPTYAASGLPGGLSFNTTTRVISGTPTAAGSGTITVTATNSEGSDDWTVAYSFVAATEAPAFADDTGDAQSWFTGVVISAITVPAATGNSHTDLCRSRFASCRYRVQHDDTCHQSGTPTAVGTGTIRIRATNSTGTDDWTVTYSTVNPLVLADSDDAGLDVDCQGAAGCKRGRHGRKLLLC